MFFVDRCRPLSHAKYGRIRKSSSWLEGYRRRRRIGINVLIRGLYKLCDLRGIDRKLLYIVAVEEGRY